MKIPGFEDQDEDINLNIDMKDIVKKISRNLKADGLTHMSEEKVLEVFKAIGGITTEKLKNTISDSLKIDGFGSFSIDESKPDNICFTADTEAIQKSWEKTKNNLPDLEDAN